MRGPDQKRFTQTSRLRQSSTRDIRGAGRTDELQQKVEHGFDTETPPSTFEQGLDYVRVGFRQQARALQQLTGINDRREQRQKALPLLARRKTVQDNLTTTIQKESLTDTERAQIVEFHDFATGFLNFISRELNVFYQQYGIQDKPGISVSSIVAAETQQHLTELIITNAKEASRHEEGQAKKRVFEDRVFDLLKEMAVQAAGKMRGEHLYNTFINGAYGVAAAYLSYSNRSENKFGKSFKVIIPSPYLDAIEQTDLLLIDEENIPKEIHEEITRAIETLGEGGVHAVNNLSKDAKTYVYKVQVKLKYGSAEMTEEDITSRDRFTSARCKSLGFDNSDYLVLNYDRAKALIERARKE